MDWINLNDEDQLNHITALSHERPQVIFKHSTRCSISSMAKNRIDKEDAPANTHFYYLDLLQHRPISNAISRLFNVEHASPQVLLIKQGKCVYHQSHSGINMQELEENF